MIRRRIQLLIFSILLLLASCSTVSRLPEGELLYTGTKRVVVADDTPAPLRDEAVGEAKVAFVSPPNNALFGSSRYRTPLPIGLWAYNAFVDDSVGLRHWLFRAFAVQPILVSAVNPELRTEVAENTLRNFGYFDSRVTYHTDTLADGRKARLSYTMLLGEAWRYGHVEYLPMTPGIDSIIAATRAQRLVHEEDQFSYASLVGERNRLFTLLRERGYYYFRSDMLSIEADTIQQPYRAQLRIGLQPQVPTYALRPWYIGNTHLSLLGDTTRAEPIRPEVLAPRILLSRGDAYSATAQDATQRDLYRLGVFSSVTLSYVPRDSLTNSDTLDVYITAMLEKPYELSLEANLTAKSNEQVGLGFVASLSRKNLLRMAETLKLRLKGSYEWQTSRTLRRESSVVNSFELEADASISVPQLLFPGGYYYHYRWPVSTTARLYADWLNRGGYFRMLAFGGNLTYAFSSSTVLTHTVTPFRLTFNTLQRTTPRFDSIMTANPAIGLSFRNQFVPAISYTIVYDNTAHHPRHPSKLILALTSAGGLTSLIYAGLGHTLRETDKTLLGTPYAQFAKATIEACRYYRLAPEQVLATRLIIGAVYPYGNSRVSPFSEQYYVGGANDLRAFPLRGIGPGSYHHAGRYAYMDRTGDLKLEANVEWRFPLTGQLHGAMFIDAGNVWLLRSDDARPGSQFRWATLGDDIALGTGFGLRYNLKMLLLRADVGIPLHIPYATSKSGYYNVPHFVKGLCFHLGVGYPF
ncbi:MAG: BamA/TamA family outer membrane protein [Bacteroidaceae bacterium]|nr:BamA/TamA family outer membrane protein [Bacteroidaceae bacterium]